MDFTYENIGFGQVTFTAVSDAAASYLAKPVGDQVTVDFDHADLLALLIAEQGFTLGPVAGDLSEIAA